MTPLGASASSVEWIDDPEQGMVANVLFDPSMWSDTDPGPLAVYMQWAVKGHAEERDGYVWYMPYLVVSDSDDLDADDHLTVMYAAADGLACTVYAAHCDDVNELERRIIRAFGLDATIDDHGACVVQVESTHTLTVKEAS